MTYGNAAGAGVNQFIKEANSKGIKIDYANDLLMVDNYLPVFDMDEQRRKIPSKNIDVNLTKIVDEVNTSKSLILNKKVSEKMMTTLAQGFYKTRKGTIDSKFIVDDKCTSCSVCEKVCPVDNIVVDAKPTYQHNCEECLGCIQLCPAGAITLKKRKREQQGS